MTKSCLYCENEFGEGMFPSRLKKQKYCSNKCRNLDRYKNNWVSTKCSECGAEFKITKYIESLYNEHYCDRNCMRKHYEKRLKGKNNPNYNNSWTEEMKVNLSLKKTGEKNFEGFKSKKRNILMGSKEYKNWRLEVFTRDNFTCQNCKKVGSGYLEAHHIKPVRSNPELIFELSNGITLCHDCHCKVDEFRYRFKKKR